MRRATGIITLLVVLFLLAPQGSLVQAGTVTLPGGWRINLQYCRNGYTASNLVVGNLASATATNNIVINSITPSATGLGPIVILGGRTIANGPFTFYWSLPQSPGTPVSASVSRVENGIVVGTLTDVGTIQDCNVAAPPPAPSAQPDNRINPDPVAPVAIYCRPNGIEILTIDGQGNGHFALLATQNQINAVGIPSRNALIAAGGGVGLFRLTSGEFQVNVPTFIASGATIVTQPQQPAPTTVTTTTTTSGDTVHLVQRGENLFRISLRYGVSMSAIAAANGITNFNLIYAGQRLVIPARGSTTVTSTTTSVQPPAAPATGSQPFVAGQDYVFVWDGC